MTPVSSFVGKSRLETVKKVVEFVSNVDPDAGLLLRPLSLGIGVAISNPELAGLDKQRDWYIAVFPKAEGDPGIVFAIPRPMPTPCKRPSSVNSTSPSIKIGCCMLRMKR